MRYELTAIVTLLSLLLYFFFAWQVGKARGKYQISAPAVSGHADFERIFRVHANTTESLLLFLPSLWLFAMYVSNRYAALIGLVWIVGRILYARSYYADAKQRGTGFLIGMGAIGVLLFGALIGAGMRLANGGV